MIRRLSRDETRQIFEATELVRLVARATPFHRFRRLRLRYEESLAQAVAETTESLDVRAERCADAFEDLLHAILDQDTEWEGWISRAGGASSDELATELQSSLGAYRSCSAARTAERLSATSDLQLSLVASEEPSAVATSVSMGLELDLSEWLAGVDRSLGPVLHSALNAVQEPLDVACKLLLRVAAEGMTGIPIVAPEPTEEGWHATFDPYGIDVTAARQAQVLARQAAALVAQTHGAGPPDTDASLEAVEPGSVETDAEPRQADDEPSPDSDGPFLAEVSVDLHRVLDGMAANVEGLESQWARRFEPREYALAMESERGLAASLLLPLQRALERESATATAAGHPDTLPEYPVPIEELGNWSSAAPDEELWTYQSTAVVHAFQMYLASLDEAEQPSRVTIAQGEPTALEFDPTCAASIRASGRMLVELFDENAATLRRLTGQNLDGLGVERAADAEFRQFARAIRVTQSFGLPEATLLYTLRLLANLDVDPNTAQASFIAAARAELHRQTSDERASRGVALMMSDALARIADQLIARSNGGTA